MRKQRAIMPVRRLIGRKAVADAHISRNGGKYFCSTSDQIESSSSSDAKNYTEIRNQFGSSAWNEEQFDVAIVGGGMVGMAFACALSKGLMTKHLNVAIIDNNPYLQSNTGFKASKIPDPRVSTVTPSSISFFKDTGAWEFVEEQRHAFFDKMQVWDYTGLGYTRYNARDVGKKWLGCVVENKVLHHSLLSAFKANAKSTQDFQWKLFPARLTSMNPKSQASSVKLDLSDGNSIQARLVVGADGSKSNVREMAEIKSEQRSYGQSAVIFTVEHERENNCAWQRFLQSGPIALLPIGDRFSNVVWTMSPDEAASQKSKPVDFLVEAVNRVMGDGEIPRPGFLGNYAERIFGSDPFVAPPRVTGVRGEIMVFPLSLMHAHDYVVKRVALVGDAAHTVHPLAGQGVNLGFADAIALVRVIADGISTGADLGEVNVLRKYEKERKLANAGMMAILDGFQKAYSVDAGPLNLLRAAGFLGAQYIPLLKRKIISYASGDQRWPLFF